ncbi:hypothetical protein ACA910_006278 [Epithemia clementina (nom. ined.)]
MDKDKGSSEAAPEGASESQEDAVADITGALIRKTFPNDFHFLCGCANFDPCGHNEMFRQIARDHFRRKITAPTGTYGAGQCKVRAEVSDVIQLATARAEQASGTKGSRFRIWKPNLEPKKRLNESNWEESCFRDITENVGSLKKNLEWPLRRALEDVRKELQTQGHSVGPTPPTVLKAQTAQPLIQSLAQQPMPIASQPMPNRNSSAAQPVMSAQKSQAVALAPKRPVAAVSAPEMVPNASIPFLIPSESMEASKLTVPFPIVETSASKRMKLDPSTPDSVVKQFVNRYNTRVILDALDRLDKDRGSKNIEEWAKEIYTTLKDNPDDERTNKLDMDRKTCLELLYDLVKAWEEYDYSEDFEQAIDCVFKTRRLVRILSVCLPLDRAQSLYYKRINSNDTNHGMPWYCEFHLKKGNNYARDHPDEHKNWILYIGGYNVPPTMNKELFRLLFSDRFGLRSNDDFKKWSRPAKVPSKDGQT